MSRATVPLCDAIGIILTSDPDTANTAMAPFFAAAGSDHEKAIAFDPVKRAFATNDAPFDEDICPAHRKPTAVGNENGALFFTTVSAVRLNENINTMMKQQFFMRGPPFNC
jgi:hypothetical protein